MGIIVKANQQELHQVGDYLLQITGNELSRKGNGKIQIAFQFADGPLKGKTIKRNCNPNVSVSSDLGKLLIAAGINIAAIPAGQQFDLDVMNGKFVWGTLTHFAMPGGGAINSLTTFRSVAGTGVPPTQSSATPTYTPPQQSVAPAYTPPQQTQMYAPSVNSTPFVPPQASAPAQAVGAGVPSKISF